jgi:hypothetical protein
MAATVPNDIAILAAISRQPIQTSRMSVASETSVEVPLLRLSSVAIA